MFFLDLKAAEGKVIKFSGFTSTSVDNKTAKGYADQNDGAVMVIIVPKGKKGRFRAVKKAKQVGLGRPFAQVPPKRFLLADPQRFTRHACRFDYIVLTPKNV